MNVRESVRNLEDNYLERRLLEIFPGLLTWSALTAPIFFSFIYPAGVAYFIIAFDSFWLFRVFYMTRNLLYSYNRLTVEKKFDWFFKLKETKNIERTKEELNEEIKKYRRKIWTKFPLNYLLRIIPSYRKKIFYYHYLKDFYQEIGDSKQREILDSDKIYQLVILATYKEDIGILRQSIEAIFRSNYSKSKIFFVLATEERDKENAIKIIEKLKEEYGDKFGLFFSTVHPRDIPGEVAGKGGNITYAARQVKKIIDEKVINYEHIITTTLDADNKVHPQYFAYLTYKYVINNKREKSSFQPMPMFTNNIWDVPAPMRIVASGSSFWQLIECTRPERLRNFSSHAQGFKTLIDTDFWATFTIVEDGHQYWRSFFSFDGDHRVMPIFLPIYQDAVLGKNYWDTLKAQYVQLRRWAWGVSDFPYVFINATKDKKISFSKKVVALYRFIEGHFTWATVPLFITITAWLPGLLNPHFQYTVLAYNLPIATSRLLSIAMVGLFANIIVSTLLLPKRPQKYSPLRYFFMVTQWILLPIVTIFFSSLPAIDAQTRLMIGKRLDWQVTRKIRKK